MNRNQTNLSVIHNILIYTSSGQKIYSYYYQEPLEKNRTTFESEILSKTSNKNKVDFDAIIIYGMLVIYKKINDITIYISAIQDENEILLDSIMNCFVETLAILLDNDLTSKMLFKYYDAVVILIDDLVDKGIILQTTPEVISQRMKTMWEANSQENPEKLEQKVKKFFANLNF